jgi:hypothetical protein
MNRFLKYWRITGRGEVFQAQIVNYADDFVILSRRCAAVALNWTRSVMPRIGLTLNEAKTSIKQARRERFDFLGYTFGPHCNRTTGWVFIGESPSKKSVARLRQKVSESRMGSLSGRTLTTSRSATSFPYRTLYLRGKLFWERRTEPDLRKAMSLFEEAARDSRRSIVLRR